jgi:anti-anti-sigma regulatory factor
VNRSGDASTRLRVGTLLDARERVRRCAVEDFELYVDRVPPRVRLVGALYRAFAAEAAERIIASRCCVVDCRELTFLDSSGLSALQAVHRYAEFAGTHVVYLGLCGLPLRAVMVSGLDRELHIV